jgi:hypothetical protein
MGAGETRPKLFTFHYSFFIKKDSLLKAAFHQIFSSLKSTTSSSFAGLS